MSEDTLIISLNICLIKISITIKSNLCPDQNPPRHGRKLDKQSVKNKLPAKEPRCIRDNTEMSLPDKQS